MQPLSRSQSAAELVAALFTNTLDYAVVHRRLAYLGYGIGTLPTRPFGITELHDRRLGETLLFCLITRGRPNE